MPAGGWRRFKASPHMCYRDGEIPDIPKNAVLVFDIKDVKIIGQAGGEQVSSMNIRWIRAGVDVGRLSWFVVSGLRGY